MPFYLLDLDISKLFKVILEFSKFISVLSEVIFKVTSHSIVLPDCFETF